MVVMWLGSSKEAGKQIVYDYFNCTKFVHGFADAWFL